MKDAVVWQRETALSRGLCPNWTRRICLSQTFSGGGVDPGSNFIPWSFKTDSGSLKDWLDLDKIENAIFLCVLWRNGSGLPRDYKLLPKKTAYEKYCHAMQVGETPSVVLAFWILLIEHKVRSFEQQWIVRWGATTTGRDVLKQVIFSMGTLDLDNYGNHDLWAINAVCGTSIDVYDPIARLKI